MVLAMENAVCEIIDLQTSSPLFHLTPLNAPTSTGAISCNPRASC